MTDEKARELLGLVDADEARLRALLDLPRMIEAIGRRAAAREWNRGTGRTTNTIVDALTYLSNHPDRSIGFRAGSSGHAAMMRRQARLWAIKLGLEYQMVKDVGSMTFRDHTCNRDDVSLPPGSEWWSPRDPFPCVE